MNAARKAERVLWPVVLAVALLSTDALARPNTNFTVDTQDAGLISLNEKIEPKEERLTFYKDEAGEVGLNENGDPAWATRF